MQILKTWISVKYEEDRWRARQQQLFESLSPGLEQAQIRRAQFALAGYVKTYCSICTCQWHSEEKGFERDVENTKSVLVGWCWVKLDVEDWARGVFMMGILKEMCKENKNFLHM